MGTYRPRVLAAAELSHGHKPDARRGGDVVGDNGRGVGRGADLIGAFAYTKRSISPSLTPRSFPSLGLYT
jgi:hypothetical protein